MSVAAATAAGLGVGVHRDVPHVAYHADPCATPSLSSSLAKVLLGKSPLHAWHQHPRLGGGGAREASDAMDRGSVIHDLLLGKGAEYAVLDFPDWRTQLSKDQRLMERAAGRIPILAGPFADCLKAAALIRERMPSLDGADTELTLVWEASALGSVALCRARFDAWIGRDATIWDIKTTDDVRRATEPRNILASGLHISAAAYLDAAETVWPDLAGRVSFRWLFAETGDPRDVVEATPAGDLLELGRKQWRRAVDLWARCLAADSWPGVAGGRTMRIEAPPWALANDLEEQARQMGGNDGADL